MGIGQEHGCTNHVLSISDGFHPIHVKCRKMADAEGGYGSWVRKTDKQVGCTKYGIDSHHVLGANRMEEGTNPAHYVRLIPTPFNPECHTEHKRKCHAILQIEETTLGNLKEVRNKVKVNASHKRTHVIGFNIRRIMPHKLQQIVSLSKRESVRVFNDIYRINDHEGRTNIQTRRQMSTIRHYLIKKGNNSMPSHNN